MAEPGTTHAGTVSQAVMSQTPALVMLTCICKTSICLVHYSSSASHFSFYQLFLTFLGHVLTPLGIQQKAWSISPG